MVESNEIILIKEESYPQWENTENEPETYASEHWVLENLKKQNKTKQRVLSTWDYKQQFERSHCFWEGGDDLERGDVSWMLGSKWKEESKLYK